VWTVIAGVAGVLSLVRLTGRTGWDSVALGIDRRSVVVVLLIVMPCVLAWGWRAERGERFRWETPPARLQAVLWSVAGVASLIVGVALYRGAPSLNIVAVELGGDAQPWPPAGGVDLGMALTRDYAFIVGYGTALWMGATAATWVFWTPRALTWARAGRAAAVLAVMADVAENLLLSGAWIQVGDRRFCLDAAAVAATVKFALLLPAVIVAVLGIVVTASRLASSYWPCLRPAGQRDWDGLGVLPPLAVEHQPLEQASAPDRHPGYAANGARGKADEAMEQRWRRAYNVPGQPKPADSPAASGICLSGGGIRSASVALGFLQTMRTPLRKADYLVSVSGGGYIAGALAQLLTDAGSERITPPAEAVRDADEAYGPGTVELDHVRRHSSYIADTAIEMLVALGVLARGLLASLVVLFGPAAPIGVLTAWFYNEIPLTVLPVLHGGASNPDPAGTATTRGANAALSLPSRGLWAIGVVVAIAAGCWLFELGWRSLHSTTDRTARRWVERATVLTRVAIFVFVTVVAVPVVVWVSGRVVSLADASAGIGIGGSVGAVVLSYLASVAALLWRSRKSITSALGGSGDSALPARVAAVPRGVVQLLLVIISVTVLCLGWLLLFGVTTIATVTDLVVDDPWPSAWLAVGVAVVVGVLGGLLDESSLSLHPFYRKRLASAFASRSVVFNTAQGPLAVPYDPWEATRLADYGKVAQSVEPFPKIVFGAAANLTGEHRTPPGRTAVSFTMDSDWCGGPEVGWVPTATLYKVSPKRMQYDLTVQGAVAISGAAIASTMGRFTRWYQVLLAVTGVRLGAWLPNPLFLSRMSRARLSDPDRVWWEPALPRIRRLTYLLREVFNLHPANERLLQYTDGGHYENLGIVELLRRRCTTIYCVDGGGDSPPTAAGLAEAITLAESELGVQITLHDPFTAEPGAGTPLTPTASLAALNAELTQVPVIVGSFRYPEASGLPDDRRDGTLYVVKALLWPKMPYQLLSYAAKHPEFPHDSTGDQWFDDAQFTAYNQLGRALGHQVKAVARVGTVRELA
jgi:hypothetical protein